MTLVSRRFLTLCLAAPVFAGCSSPYSPGVMCTLELRSTIAVEITDARSGAAIPIGSTVIVRGAAFNDSVVVTTALSNPRMGYLAWEDKAKGGRYTVEVRKPGYVDWINTSVDVPSDQCHSGPGPLVTAALTPRT